MRQARIGVGLSGSASPAAFKRSRRKANNRKRSLARLRSLYFATASEAAVRYGITFDHVVAHLWHARAMNEQLALREVVHMEDLVHAIACASDTGLAWSDLADRYELPLVRRCRHGMTEIDATIAVRRMLADLRRQNFEQAGSEFSSLREYAGVQPLGVWLGDRVVRAAAWTRPRSVQRELVASGRSTT